MSGYPEYQCPGWWKPHARGLPGWRAHQGEDSLYYARLPGTQPMVVVNAKTPEKLRDAVWDELRKMDQEE